MIIYPAGSSIWALHDSKLQPVPDGTMLRFVVRKPLPPDLIDDDFSFATRMMNENPERHAEIKDRIKANPIPLGEKNINVVFRDMFEIDYSRLTLQNGQQKHPRSNIFFLCFIPQGCDQYEPDPRKRAALYRRTSEEHDLWVKFLQANGAEEIYSLQNIGSHIVEDNGAWDYFINNVKSGQIIVSCHVTHRTVKAF